MKILKHSKQWCQMYNHISDPENIAIYICVCVCVYLYIYFFCALRITPTIYLNLHKNKRIHSAYKKRSGNASISN